MSKESISHRYDIEYTHPTILKKTTKRSWTGRVFIIIAIFTALFLIGIFYKNGRISEYLQELVTSYTRDDKKNEYNNFNMSNHALPIATTKADVEEKQNTDEVADRDNFQGEILNTITVKKSDPSQIFNSGSKITPVEEPLSSSITSAKPVVKKVIPKPSLKNTSNRHPTTEAPATKTPSTKVSNATTPSFNITNNNTTIDTKKDLEIEQNEKKTRIESLTKLDDLLKQLSTKSKESEGKQKNNQSSNNLSKLLANSSNNNKNNDKQYLSALENLNEAKPINKVSKKRETSSTTAANNKSDTIVKDKKEAITQQKITSKSKMTVAVEVTEEERKELNAANNTISLSMKAQVDAIILTMQANKKPTKIAKLKKKTTADLTTEMLSANIELQNKNDDLINQLSQNIGENPDASSNTRKNNLISVNSENKLNRLTTPRNSNLNYERALNQESIVRSNAVRSIVVKKGETLWSIAKRAYGDGKYYKKILAANPQIRRNKTVRLVIGQIIRVPK